MFLVLFFGAGIVAMRRSRKQRQAGWREVAERSGLEYRTVGRGRLPSVSGAYRDRVVSLNMTGSNRSYVLVSIVNGKKLYVSLRRRRRLDLWLGAQRRREGIVTGDREFDRRFRLSATPLENAPAILAWPTIRQSRRQLDRVAQLSLVVGEKVLVFRQEHIDSEPPYLLCLSHLALDLAQAVADLRAEAERAPGHSELMGHPN
jgi:hypothetical protein